jgi:hypothetical protein
VAQGSITQRAVDGLMELGTGFIRKTFSRG